MKYLKCFENYNIKDIIFIKCNNCDWFGTEDDLEEEEDSDVCPSCKQDDFLMDIYPFDDDFNIYIKNAIPQKNIKKEDYDNITDYYKALYPDYFNIKKYNL